jgi:protein-tyrosine-phosphatase
LKEVANARERVALAPSRGRNVNIVTLCTGNVARSVMLGHMLATLGEASGEQWSIRTAGTLVTEGSAISARTRDAMRGIPELGECSFGAHRSHQINDEDVEWADVILASEASQVRFVRGTFGNAHGKVVQLVQFVRRAPIEVPFAEQLAAVSELPPSSLFNVEDPAGGDQADYDTCAAHLWEFAKAFALLVGAQPRD